MSEDVSIGSAFGHASQREETSRIRILDAAADAFMERGYTATSIVDIADRLGATKGSVYHWYRSKAQIYLDVHMRAIEMIIEAVEPIARSAGTPSERLHRMIEAHALMLMHEFGYQRVALQTTDMRTLEPTSLALRQVSRQLVGRRDDYEQLFADVIAAGTAAGEFRDWTPRFATKPVLGAANWITRWYDPARSTPERTATIARDTAVFVVAGLRRDAAG